LLRARGQNISISRRRPGGWRLANIQVVGTNAISATMFLVTPRKIKIRISHPSRLPTFPSLARQTNNYFSHRYKRRGMKGSETFSWFISEMKIITAVVRSRKILAREIKFRDKACVNRWRTHLATKTEYEEHKEEQYGPKIRPWHARHCLRINNKG